jgi:hypothetical protein
VAVAGVATTTATASELFDASRHLFGSVPGLAGLATAGCVCSQCLGPAGEGYRWCLGCDRLYGSGGAPHELAAIVVPLTTALNPSAWYSRLITYKKGYPEHLRLLGALASTWLRRHRAAVAALLGGEPGLLTVVPSKRGVDYERQPLRQALAHFGPPPFPLRQTLRHLEGGHRHQYTPEIFAPVTTSLREQRIVLVEDTWVTGATALSAAGALLDHGAAAVCVLPLARCIDANFWGESHPYRAAMRTPYDVARWPR